MPASQAMTLPAALAGRHPTSTTTSMSRDMRDLDSKSIDAQADPKACAKLLLHEESLWLAKLLFTVDRMCFRWDILNEIEVLNPRKRFEVGVLMDLLRYQLDVPTTVQLELRSALTLATLPNYYAVLGLPRNYTQAEFRRRVKTIGSALQAQYGLSPTSPAAVELTQLFNAAKDTLGKKHLRESYDNHFRAYPAASFPKRGSRVYEIDLPRGDEGSA